jgi:hypothetical protein
MNHKGNIKFSNPLQAARSISNKERGGPPERKPSLDKPSPKSIIRPSVTKTLFF